MILSKSRDTARNDVIYTFVDIILHFNGYSPDLTAKASQHMIS